MDSGQFVKQMIGFQKTAFNHTFDIFMAIEDQAGKIACSWCEKNGLIPAQTKNIIHQWQDAFQQNLRDCQNLFNDTLENMESIFYQSSSAVKPGPISLSGEEGGKSRKTGAGLGQETEKEAKAA